MLTGFYTGKYQGKEMCGFIPKHNYKFELSKNQYGYICDAIEDLSQNITVSGSMNYASEISIKRNWDKLELEMNLN